MSRNTSMIIGEHYQTFIQDQVNKGYYASTSEVMRAALNLFEIETNKQEAFRAAVQKGLDSRPIPWEEAKVLIAKDREEVLKERGLL